MPGGLKKLCNAVSLDPSVNSVPGLPSKGTRHNLSVVEALGADTVALFRKPGQVLQLVVGLGGTTEQCQRLAVGHVQNCLALGLNPDKEVLAAVTAACEVENSNRILESEAFEFSTIGGHQFRQSAPDMKMGISFFLATAAQKAAAQVLRLPQKQKAAEAAEEKKHKAAREKRGSVVHVEGALEAAMGTGIGAKQMLKLCEAIVREKEASAAHLAGTATTAALHAARDALEKEKRAAVEKKRLRGAGKAHVVKVKLPSLKIKVRVPPKEG